MNIDFGNKRFLVVDDFEKFRNVLRGIIQLFGGKHIEIATNGNEAIAKIRNKSFDVVLCDYHLGQGKNGQQVLEQLRHEKLLPESSVFLMVTAEGGAEMVMGAIEHQPDGYLVKPFNQAMLKSRLSKILQQKNTLSPIYEAITADKVIVAIERCQKLAKTHPHYLSIIKKIEAELLIQAGDYLGAEDIYKKTLAQRHVPWAALGLGKVKYHLAQYQECIDVLNELIHNNKLQLQAYDWIAQAYLRLEKPVEAQNVLQQAVALSPKTILRHVELGSLALQIGDYECAESSFREAVTIGRTSCHKTPDNYIKFARSTQPKLASANENTKKHAAEETFTYLNEVQAEYKSNKDVMIEATLMEVQAYSQLSDENKAKSSMEKVETMVNDYHGELPKKLKLEMIESMAKLGNTDEATEAASKLSTECKNDPEIIEQLGQYIKNSPLNSQGMELYKQGKYQEAIETFTLACNEFSASISFRLNAIQAIIKQLEENGKDDELIQCCKKHFASINTLPATDRRYHRHEELLRLFNSLE